MSNSFFKYFMIYNLNILIIFGLKLSYFLLYERGIYGRVMFQNYKKVKETILIYIYIYIYIYRHTCIYAHLMTVLIFYNSMHNFRKFSKTLGRNCFVRTERGDVLVEFL